ncbi:unnamed protein product [Allacma fusca]|uniref:4'-phosphopantetheine phosphatase n=2 Tax=Allacma fusca TaxID=39272 RepID=A0A8J2LF31_9HEXA|nr:unnamed protein product [Allacma fusca]
MEGPVSSKNSDRIASLPLHDYTEVFRNLSNARRFAIDIGGSLTKIAYFSTVSHRRVTLKHPDEQGPELSPTSPSKSNGSEEESSPKFETNLVGNDNKIIKATGGGAHKYTNLIKEKLSVEVDKEDEMTCLIKGSNFLLKNVSDEAFKYDKTRKNKEYQFQRPTRNIFPYLLVNIGSGVSILKVDSEEQYNRIGGTATGGGTFWGLGSLLTGKTSFDELLDLAEIGDHRNVDMLVQDIYAGSLTKLGLEGDTVASSFGKCMLDKTFDKADLVRSLLFTIANDIGQISSLYALRYGLKKIYFGGYFLRNHPVSMSAITFSVNFWGKGEVEGLFLRHEGYVGAIGAFLIGMEDEQDGSWAENFIGSSGHLCASGPGSSDILSSIERLEIDKLEPIGFFPLLKSSCDYTPDTLDLSSDAEARDYWLQCFQAWIDKVPMRAIESQQNTPSALDRALRCRQKLLARFQLLKTYPFAYGTLSVRSLLDTIEQTLREYDFPDPYLAQKQLENSVAISEFEARIQYLDTLDDPVLELIEEVSQILEGPDNFGFADARNKLQSRPWLIDGIDAWKDRIQNGPPHKCVIIFVDNSGYDFVLGALPLVRWFLQRGTEVIISANTNPALNDMTFAEMLPVLEQISEKPFTGKPAAQSVRPAETS